MLRTKSRRRNDAGTAKQWTTALLPSNRPPSRDTSRVKDPVVVAHGVDEITRPSREPTDAVARPVVLRHDLHG